MTMRDLARKLVVYAAPVLAAIAAACDDPAPPGAGPMLRGATTSAAGSGAPPTASSESAGAAALPSAAPGTATAAPPPSQPPMVPAATPGPAAAPMPPSAPGEPAPPAEVLAPTCPAPLMAGNRNESVEHGGRMRTFLVHIPRNYTGDTPVPVVFDFHGYGQSGAGQAGLSGFQAKGEEEGFITVFPDGVGASWNVNGCCAQAAEEKLDEIGFVRAIAMQLASEACIDPKRIYASGISQGAGMAHHVGCLAADIFAAVAPVSSDLRTDPCMPARPISELSFRGLADQQSPAEGGEVGPAGMTYTSIGATPTLERWAEIDGCTGTPAMSQEYCQTYSECAGGVEVTLCLLPGTGHVAYQNSLGFDIPSVAWEMFERQPKP
jgi:polyhydroxybutyrate depolymerase